MALKISQNTLPGIQDEISSTDAIRISSKLEEWHKADYAGFSRIIDSESDCHPDLEKLAKLAKACRTNSQGQPIRDFVILGIGGSSLGAEAILRALRPPLKEPRFHIADNSDPTMFSWLLGNIRPEESLFYVVAKSGGTPETLSQFLIAVDWARKALGENWKKHFVLCTDPAKGDLRALSKRWQLACLDIPPAVGGRFSVLSPVGLFPAAFAGLKVEDFLRGASEVANWSKKNWGQNPCARVGISLARNAKRYPITVLMPYSSQLGAFSRWFCQLWAESLGKQNLGLTPYPAIGATDQHSQMQLYMEGPRDKSLIFIHIARVAQELPIPFHEDLQDLPSFALLKNRSVGKLLEAEFRATRDAVTKAGIPNCTIEMESLNEFSLGALFYFWEMATAIAGAILEVNPFDQPGVEAAKILTKEYLQN